VKKIKHNDLTHYFMTPHEQLPASYLASCEKFFKELSIKQQAPLLSIKKSYCNRLAKLQAPSCEARRAEQNCKKQKNI